MLTRHAGDPKVIRMCFKLITNLAYHSKSNKHAMLSFPQPPSAKSASGTRLVDIIFSCVDAHQKDIPLIADALVSLRALMNVSQGKNFFFFSRLTVLDTINRDTPPFVLKKVLALLQAHKDNALVVAPALWVLAIIVTERPALKQLFATQKGVNVLLEVLEKHKYVVK